MQSVKISNLRTNLSTWANEVKSSGPIRVETARGSDLILMTELEYLSLTASKNGQLIKIGKDDFKALRPGTETIAIPGNENISLGKVTLTDGKNLHFGEIRRLELTSDSTLIELEILPF